jgi:hypothetical protein
MLKSTRITKKTTTGSRKNKYKMAAAAILELHKLRYLGHFWTDFVETWHTEADCRVLQIIHSNLRYEQKSRPPPPPSWISRNVLLFLHKLTDSHKNLALAAAHRASTKNLNKESEKWKSKMAAAAILEIQKLRYLGHLWADFDETWRAEADWCALRNVYSKWSIEPNTRWPPPPSWISRNVLLFLQKLTDSHKNLALAAMRRAFTKNLNTGSKKWKSKMAAVAILELHKLRYIGHLWADFDETWRAEADWRALRNIHSKWSIEPNSRWPPPPSWILCNLLFFHKKLTDSHKSFALAATRRAFTKNLNTGSNKWKSKMAAAAILESRKLQYLGHLWTDFVETWHAEAHWHAPYEIYIPRVGHKKIQDGRRRHLEFHVMYCYSIISYFLTKVWH